MDCKSIHIGSNPILASMKYEVMNFKKELLSEKKKIQKMKPSLLKQYALWDIEKELKSLS